MLEQYNSWYRKVGIINPTHLARPKLTLTKEFTFPKNSLLHWAYTDIIPTIPKKTDSILTNSPKETLVTTVYEYPLDYTPLGKFTKNNASLEVLIKDLGKQELNFTFFRKDYMEKKDENALYINNYGILDSRYNYIENKFTIYNRTINLLNTLVYRLRDLPLRKHLIAIPLPPHIPDRIQMNNILTRVDRDDTKLKLLTSYRHVYLLELWRWLTPEYKEKSVFNKISLERAKNIDFVFIGINKCFVINMYMLYNTVREYKDEKSIDGYTSEILKKYLHTIFISLNSIDVSQQLAARTIKINKKDIVAEDEEAVEDQEETLLDKVEDQIDTTDNVTDVKTLIDSEEEDEVNENMAITSDLEFSTSDINTLDELNQDTDLFGNLNNKLDIMVSHKMLSNKQYNDLKDVLNSQLTETNLYCDAKLEDVLDQSKDDYSIDKNTQSIRDIPIIPSKDMNSKTTQSVDKSYREKQYNKDIVRVLYSLQKNNSIVLSHTVDRKESVLGVLEEHNIKLKTLNGKDSEIKIVLPVIDQYGKFQYSNSKYIMRAQKLDLPIVKIAYDTVALTSFYGKLFIYKGRLSVENKGSWLLNQLAKHPDIENFITGKSDTKDLDLPLLYTLLGRNVKYFKYKDYIFNLEYNKRYTIFKNITEEEINKLDKRLKQDELVLIGKYKNKPMVMDYEDRLFTVEDKSYNELEDFYTLLNIEETTAPIESSTVRVLNKFLPVGLLLAYYLGLTNLLSLLEIKYEQYEPNKRVAVDKNTYLIKFKDAKYLITKDHSIGDMVIGGLLRLEKYLKEISYSVLENKDLFTILFSKLELNVAVITEIKLMENLFVDPMTKSVLTEMKEPVTFKGLLIRASELLVSDYYKNPNDLHSSLLKGYERIPGMVYKELITELKNHENRSYFSKSKITVNPYSVLQKIQEDSSTIAVDDLNPMAMIKQKEDTTQIGAGGRNKDAISKENRQVDKSMIGVISEAHKDSGDVGITSSLTANPIISNTRGIFGDTEKDIQGWSNRVSTSAMLAPFGLMDDVKRLDEEIGPL